LLHYQPPRYLELATLRVALLLWIRPGYSSGISHEKLRIVRS
jgi:hypothetical protein